MVGDVTSNGSLCHTSVSSNTTNHMSKCNANPNNNGGNSSNNSCSNSSDNADIINTGIIMLADGANKYLLSQPLSLLCQAHRKLLPLSDYKVIHVNGMNAIISYMNACHDILLQMEHIKTTPNSSKRVHVAKSDTNYRDFKVNVPCLIAINNEKITDKLCVPCVTDCACMIERVCDAIMYDKKMNVTWL